MEAFAGDAGLEIRGRGEDCDAAGEVFERLLGVVCGCAGGGCVVEAAAVEGFLDFVVEVG